MSEKKCSVCKQVGTLKNVYNAYDDTYHYDVCTECVDIIRIYNEQNCSNWNIYHEIT